MVLGIDALVPSLGDVLGSRTGLVVQSLIGLALLVYSLPPRRHARKLARVRPQARTRCSRRWASV